MKWYNHRIYIAHKNDLKINRDDLKEFYPYVLGMANTFPRDAVAIGTLDINDLIQAGHEGLWIAWKKTDIHRHDGEIWSFLKKRVKWAIRREIDKHAMIISIPINKLEEARSDLADKLGIEDLVLVNVFPKFFDGELIVKANNSQWKSIQLEKLIDIELEKHVKDVDQRDMIKMFYGIGFPKMSIKEIAEKYRIKNPLSVTKKIQRVRDKLRTNEFKKIIENFYKKES